MLAADNPNPLDQTGHLRFVAPVNQRSLGNVRNGLSPWQPAKQNAGASEDWRINVVGVRLTASGRSGNRGEATVTYDKVVRLTDRNLPDVTTRHVASVVFQYQPKVLAKERDRLENPFGFVVMAYRSDPEINTSATGAKP